MNPQEHGKPGETWRARSRTRWVDWLILDDGEAKEAAEELGYEDPVVMVSAMYPDDEGTVERYPPAELKCLYHLGDPIFGDPDDGAWEKVYPEHEKLRAVKDRSQAIGEFLDFGKYTLCELRPNGTVDVTGEEILEFMPVGSIHRVLAEHFDIDLDKIDAEQRDMLDMLRRA